MSITLSTMDKLIQMGKELAYEGSNSVPKEEAQAMQSKSDKMPSKGNSLE